MYKSKIYLSSTNIQTFLNCKRKFKYKYVDRVKVETKIASKYLSFGNSIHSTLAQFNKITDEKYRSVENLHALLRKNWKREGYSSIDEEREYGLKALDMLSNYLNDPKDQGQKNIIIEEMIRKDMDGKFILNGKLDKVYLREDNQLETVDYKTGNTIEGINKIQIQIYILLTKEKTGRYPDIVSYYYMAHNKKIEQKVTKELIDEITEILWDVYHRISIEKEYPCNPNFNCESTCEYYDICEGAKDENLVVINSLREIKDVNSQIKLGSFSHITIGNNGPFFSN